MYTEADADHVKVVMHELFCSFFTKILKIWKI